MRAQPTFYSCVCGYNRLIASVSCSNPFHLSPIPQFSTPLCILIFMHTNNRWVSILINSIRTCARKMPSSETEKGGERRHRVDPREPTHVLKHGAPVECVCFFPSGNLLVSAGGNLVRVWDLRGDGGMGKLVETIQPHANTVMSVCVTSDGGCMVTGSLDSTVKVIDTQTFDIHTTYNMAAGVMRVCLSPDEMCIGIGMSGGQWVVRRRQDMDLEANQHLAPAAVRIPLPGTAKYFKRGRNEKAEEADHIVGRMVRPKLNRLETLMKEFKYQQAFDLALTQPPQISVSYLEELHRIGALEIAMRGRDEKSVLPILDFLVRTIGQNPTYTHVASAALKCLLDQNTWLAGTCDGDIIKRLRALSMKMVFELQNQDDLTETAGFVEMALSQGS
eukprot:GDKI01027563.1.p1 GENE.GDKI01027563.1~~GDKI01027563.1.p1  ORF type:complete len:390 (-),score=94.79 GDKI01027563.1:48-1217(-)